ncbi:MAG: NUDIX domain-containing protein [Gammaproteobacteria bacterium]
MANKSQKRLSSGVVVSRETSKGSRFLMLRAFTHWDFPKGMVEQGERPKQAALREVKEETTITDLEFPWGNQFIETGPYSKGKTARYYIGVTRQLEIELPVNPEIGRPEHVEFRWVSLRQAKSLTSPRVVEVLNWAAAVMELEAVSETD